MEKFNVVVIGVGALGKRHLSSIMQSELALNVFCYDINVKALENFEWEDTNHNKTLKMIHSLDLLPQKVDFAVFAMTSSGRREMFDKLLENTVVKNILFEKVLFQRIEDYYHVKTKLDELKINAWVNCARRQMDSYNKLKHKLLGCSEMEITISGGEWGLACNAIHLLDLVSYLSNCQELTIMDYDFMPGLFESKRQGYLEVYGTIDGKCGKCKKFSITCMKGTDVPITITINTDKAQYYIIESKKKIISMLSETKYDIDIAEFDIPYQSQMTQFVMEEVLLSGTSRLTRYDESAKLHIAYLDVLLDHFHENGMEGDSCLIT